MYATENLYVGETFSFNYNDSNNGNGNTSSNYDNDNSTTNDIKCKHQNNAVMEIEKLKRVKKRDTCMYAESYSCSEIF